MSVGTRARKPRSYDRGDCGSAVFAWRLVAVDYDACLVKALFDGSQAVHPRAVIVTDGQGVGSALGRDEDALLDQFGRGLGAG